MTLDELLAAVQKGEISPEKAERLFSSLRNDAPRVAPVTTDSSTTDRRISNSDTGESDASGIAIIGIAGRFPESESIDALWEHLTHGHDLIREIPPERWSIEDALEQGIQTQSCRWGGFMPNAARNPAEFFSTLQPKIEITEPQELHFAQVVWGLFERAGYSREELRRRVGSEVGLYLGARANGVPGALPVVLANRISSFFGLLGPSLAIDAMSASSMSALHLACQALATGDCKMAIAAGISVLSKESYSRMAELNILATSADVRSFSQGRAMLPSEAMCAVLLKPLRAAIRDRDRVLAVIKASGAANAGTFAQTAPPRARLIAGVLEKAGVDARTIGYVETSAAGDALADAVEVSALTSAFRGYDVAAASCPIGSVKSNLGHALAASGMTQLAKVVLQLQHRKLVPSIKADADFPQTPFRLQRDLAEWQPSRVETAGEVTQVPRRALIDSYGGGGSMVCVIIEEFVPIGQGAPDAMASNSQGYSAT